MRNIPHNTTFGTHDPNPDTGELVSALALDFDKSPEELAILPVDRRGYVAYYAVRFTDETEAFERDGKTAFRHIDLEPGRRKLDPERIEVEPDNEHLLLTGGSYSRAADEYKQSGFWLKAATLRERSAEFYIKIGRFTEAKYELIDAFKLGKNTDKVVKEHPQDLEVPLRANFPNLDMRYMRQLADGNELARKGRQVSSAATIFRIINEQGGLLLSVVRELGEDTKAARKYLRDGIYEVSPKRAEEYERSRRGLFRYRP